MRAMAVTRYDEPLMPVDLPEPEVLPGTALLEVLTCGVCFSDVKTSRGLRELELVGSRFAHRDDLERAVALVAAGAVRPVVGLIRPLEDVNEALEAGRVAGRAVLNVAGV